MTKRERAKERVADARATASERVADAASAASGRVADAAAVASERVAGAKTAADEFIARQKPRLRGVSHEWAFFVSLVAGAVLVGVALVLGRTGPARIGVSTRPPWGPAMRGLARSARFLRLYAAVLVVAPSLYVGLLFLPSYTTGRGSSSGTGAALVTTLGVASAAGRVGLAALARRLPALVLFRACFALLAASSVLWAAAGSGG